MRCYYILESMELQGTRDVTYQTALHATHDARAAAMLVSVSNGASLHDDSQICE
jgi:hypothetical protein